MGKKQDNLPRVSVVISSYNYGTFISEAIESILAQTVPSDVYEIIVVDDGSTDDTCGIVSKFGYRVKYTAKENGGHASGLNLGFNLARGGIVMFMDPDDTWDKNKIERIIDCYNRLGCSSVSHNIRIWRDNGTTEKYHKDYFIEKLKKVDDDTYYITRDNVDIGYRFFSTLSSQSYSREICLKMFPIPLYFKKHADLYLRTKGLMHADIVYLHEPLSNYRQHKMSHTANIVKDHHTLRESLHIQQSFLKELSAEKPSDNSKILTVLENRIIEDKFLYEKRHGRSRNAFRHMLRMEITGSPGYRMFRRLSLLLMFLFPEEVYLFFRRQYYKTFFFRLRRMFLKDVL